MNTIIVNVTVTNAWTYSWQNGFELEFQDQKVLSSILVVQFQESNFAIHLDREIAGSYSKNDPYHKIGRIFTMRWVL